MKNLHRRIARAAFKRGILTPETLIDLLSVLSDEQLNGGEQGLRFWIESDWLDRAQLAEVLGDLGVGLQLGAMPDSEGFSDEAVEQAEKDLEFVVAQTALHDGSQLAFGGAQTQLDRAPTQKETDLAHRFDSVSQTLVHDSSSPQSKSGGEDDFGERRDEEGGLQPITEAEEFRREPTMRFDENDETGAISSSFGYAATVIKSDVEHFSVGQRPEGLDGGATPGNPRYVLGRELGRGGGGRVMRAFDRMLGRTVAMKILARDIEIDESMINRFVAEAQATGQLEHPNIVPVYDFGVLPTGEVFYTMREVRRQSLRGVMQLLRSGDLEANAEYTLVKLVSILRQVCQAVDYAHSRGVVHRDLKPDNIMLGDFGEVLVMDWGLARILETGVRTNRVEESSGHTLGTPAYMSPEQARGQMDQVDQLSDVYSLGAILFEILTLEPPFDGANAVEVMWNVVEAELIPPRQRAPEGRPVPEELERLCQRALEREREQRFRSAREFHNALEDWLEGVQSYEASQKVVEGEHAARLFIELERVVETLEQEVQEISSEIEDWAPIERKRAIWETEDQLEQAKASSARSFGDAVSQYTQALAYQPDNGRARAGLAQLYWERLRQARASRDVTNEIYFEALVRQYDEGKYAARLDGVAQIAVETDPPGGQIDCFRLKEIDRRLVAASDIDLGQAPTRTVEIEPGAYLLVVQPEGDGVPFRQPIFLDRGEDRFIHLVTPASDALQAGFIYVPGGEAVVGGDPFAFEARPARVVDVASFFCAQFPVTFRQYLDFLNELQQEDPALALERAPQTRGSDGFLVRLEADTNRWVPDEILIEGPARDRYPVGEAHEYDIPVVGVRAEDAEAYCAWRAERDGRAFRLPTETELEKAGRGVDGRVFPWGERFDATFCKMRFSRPSLPQLEPVGAFPDDSSPYGIRDLGGGVQEWCAAEEGSDEIDRLVKGGAWNQDARSCRMASRIRILAGARAAGIGFRLVYPYSPTDSKPR